MLTANLKRTTTILVVRVIFFIINLFLFCGLASCEKPYRNKYSYDFNEDYVYKLSFIQVTPKGDTMLTTTVGELFTGVDVSHDTFNIINFPRGGVVKLVVKPIRLLVVKKRMDERDSAIVYSYKLHSDEKKSKR